MVSFTRGNLTAIARYLAFAVNFDRSKSTLIDWGSNTIVWWECILDGRCASVPPKYELQDSFENVYTNLNSVFCCCIYIKSECGICLGECLLLFAMRNLRCARCCLPIHYSFEIYGPCGALGRHTHTKIERSAVAAVAIGPPYLWSLLYGCIYGDQYRAVVYRK